QRDRQCDEHAQDRDDGSHPGGNRPPFHGCSERHCYPPQGAASRTGIGGHTSPVCRVMTARYLYSTGLNVPESYQGGTNLVSERGSPAFTLIGCLPFFSIGRRIVDRNRNLNGSTLRVGCSAASRGEMHRERVRGWTATWRHHGCSCAGSPRTMWTTSGNS